MRVARGAPAKAAERRVAGVAVIDTDVGRGMGFAIDPHGYILTNRHVLEDADHIEGVRFPDANPPLKFSSVRIEYVDPERDLALLKVDGQGRLPHIPVAAARPAKEGAYLHRRDPVAVWALGDKDSDFQRHDGAIQKLAIANDLVGPSRYFQLSATIEEGQSGGPVMDRYGRAVGVVTWTRPGLQGGFAIPISEAASMLAERPAFTNSDDLMDRAILRVRAYLAALSVADLDSLRRMTSPSFAKSVRADVMGQVVAGMRQGQGTALAGFVYAVEQLVDRPEMDEETFLKFQALVGQTSKTSFRQAMGLDSGITDDHLMSFFFEFGRGYLGARFYGHKEPDDAIEAAMRRLRTVDAARTFVVAHTAAKLSAGVARVERIEMVPGAFAPKAQAVLRVAAEPAEEGLVFAQGPSPEVTARLHLKFEWGDWYIADVRPLP